MTSGGLMQLVAYGAQDVYLTANPQVTFFKQLYRRHSNFAMESIEQTFNGVGNFGKRVQCTISRNGDLITRVYVQVTLPAIDGSVLNGASFAWVPYLGQYMIDNVYVEIGGQQIDKHYGEWLHIWNELTLPTGKQLAYLNMVNGYGGVVLDVSAGVVCSTCTTEVNVADAKNLACVNPSIISAGADCAFANGTVLSQGLDGLNDLPYSAVTNCIPERTLYIPLEFWFNRHTGLALPLIALQYHEVKINVEFNTLQYLCNIAAATVGSGTGTVNSVLNAIGNAGLVACSLYVDYVYLDTEERRRFAQVAHEYLIEQLQFTGTESVTSTSNKIQLSFNHPCKELIWVVQNPSYLDCNSVLNSPWRYSDAALGNPTAVAKVQLNGQDRFTEREGSYFNFVQPFQHHTTTPATGVNVYSFALKPEDLQPSGSCNFSRIDNAVLNLTLTPATFFTNVVSIAGANATAVGVVGGTKDKQTSANVNIYATNYNVLRIMSGMGGLAYSN